MKNIIIQLLLLGQLTVYGQKPLDEHRNLPPGIHCEDPVFPRLHLSLPILNRLDMHRMTGDDNPAITQCTCPRFETILAIAAILGVTREEILENADYFCGFSKSPENDIGTLAGRLGHSYKASCFCKRLINASKSALIAAKAAVEANLQRGADDMITITGKDVAEILAKTKNLAQAELGAEFLLRWDTMFPDTNAGPLLLQVRNAMARIVELLTGTPIDPIEQLVDEDSMFLELDFENQVKCSQMPKDRFDGQVF